MHWMVLHRPVELAAFIKHLDYFQLRRDRGVGGKAKAKSVISPNERAQTYRPSN
jgi:hypothetical protein